jgi:DNA polymerase sigma
MDYINKTSHFKIIIFIFFTIFFTIIYILFDDYNFTGLNKVSEVIKDEIIKEEVKEDVKEEVNENKLTPRKTKVNFEGFEPYINNYQIEKEKEKKDAIEDKTEEVDKDIENEELTKEKIKPTLKDKIFNRLYFSISTGGLLGYGDVYPNTNKVKMVTMLQVLTTICLIVF